MNKLAKQGRLFAAVLVFLWLLVIAFAWFRVWLFMDDDITSPSPEHLKLFNNIFFVVLGLITLLIAIIGFVVSRLYNSLGKAVERIEHEHKSALKQEREKIRIKRQLTNNINHELKTPICSILGYLEMILNNDNLDKKSVASFVQKSYDQAERLRRLMTDLSTITRIDEASAMVDRERLDVSTIILNVADDTMPQAEQMSIMVNTNVDREALVYGNSMLLYSIFRNLVDNAIAYSGGRHINIELVETTHTHHRFIVRDNGIGVDDKHLPYIFERFYRVDAGRSRKVGGTGLGLSIVKNAVLFHGGNILARAAVSGGLEFELTLKRLSK